MQWLWSQLLDSKWPSTEELSESRPYNIAPLSDDTWKAFWLVLFSYSDAASYPHQPCIPSILTLSHDDAFDGYLIL